VACRTPNFEQYIVDLRRYARALLGDPQEADELVQECLLRALARPHFWRRVKNVRAYLFAIMHNAYVDQMAARRRVGTPVGLDQVVTRLSHPPVQHATLELRDMASALSRLPGEQREVVLLVALEGLSYQETADALGIPLGTVMSRLSRGRDALRRLVDGDRLPLGHVRERVAGTAAS
jgi:RNA polymerase sigma-70 factor (ECF subfamily)